MSTVVQSDQLSLVFTALSHPVRRAILELLMEGKANASELAEPFDISQAMITKHLKILERAHLIDRSQKAQLRFSELNPEPLKVANNWINKYEELWKGKLDRLENYYQKYTKKENTENDE